MWRDERGGDFVKNTLDTPKLQSFYSSNITIDESAGRSFRADMFLIAVHCKCSEEMDQQLDSYGVRYTHMLHEKRTVTWRFECATDNLRTDGLPRERSSLCQDASASFVLDGDNEADPQETSPRILLLYKTPRTSKDTHSSPSPCCPEAHAFVKTNMFFTYMRNKSLSDMKKAKQRALHSSCGTNWR